MRLLPLLASCLVIGCTTPGDPDGASPCIDQATRDKVVVAISGQVVDFATGAPIGGAQVEINTAWDVAGFFPRADCPVPATVTSGADGSFGPVNVAVGSPLVPIVSFQVTGAERTPTISDSKLVCSPDCASVSHVIAAPSAALAAGWRAELVRGGMADDAAAGLVVYYYKNADQTPAMAVSPMADARPPVLGRELRYLELDRVTLAPADQAVTTASGLAVFGHAAPATSISVSGDRGGEAWPRTSVLVHPGWVSLEDRTVITTAAAALPAQDQRATGSR